MLNELSPFPITNFFNISLKIKQQDSALSYLPEIASLINEQLFARVAIAWSISGLILHIHVSKPLETSFYPKYRNGDSIELFFDTRDLKNAPSIHRFCHHFIFLPQEVDGIRAQEITRFHSNQTHELADSEFFAIQMLSDQYNYHMKIDLPQEALHGYQPAAFNRLGFAYQINRKGGTPQHFPLSSRFFSLEKHPDLWATLILS